MKGKVGTSSHMVKGFRIDSSAINGGLCPACGSSDKIKNKGVLRKINGKFGDFLGCSRYPDCKFTKKLK